MITSIVLFIFLGTFALYNTSKKAVLNNHTSLNKWLQANIKQSKIIGVISLILALILALLMLGIMGGFLTWLIALMIALSLLIIFAPTGIFNRKKLIILFVLIFVLELLSNL
ncbi:conserved membrane protein of unknown function [Tenacibaculum sp. 190130A14a]|uniref:DUF3325 domain-containing protein n=1 Tax=Tenacibaculum polynesiense TaxID=3137857 RepID=A0ABP1F070_9FLAO